MRTLLLLAGLTVCGVAWVLPASAETNLFDNGTWTLVGGVDADPAARDINVTVDKLPAGGFSELKVYFNYAGLGSVPVFSLTGRGPVQPLLPAPVEPGGVFYLTRFTDCERGLVPPVAITDLEFRTRSKPNGPLLVRGKLSNFDSLESVNLLLKFYPAKTNSISVLVRYGLKATQDLCVDQTLRATQDVVRIATMAANFVSAETNQNNRVRYTRIKSVTCPVVTGCITEKESYCADLANARGYLFPAPRRLAGMSLALLHTQVAPLNTPTLAVEFRAPLYGHIKPQAYVSATDDPSALNAEVWGNWLTPKKKARAGRPVGRFRFFLEARDPGNPGCDVMQPPPSP